MYINMYSYERFCWRCGADISSVSNQRCGDCHWYICNNCGACKINGCIGKYSYGPSYSVTSSRRKNVNPLIQLEEEVPVVDYEAMWSGLKSNAPVEHTAFGRGEVIAYFTKEHFRYLKVRFAADASEKVFVFPDAASKGLLKICG